MDWLIILGLTAIAVVIIVIAVRKNDANMDKLVSEGRAAKRERTFWMQQTMFSTDTSSVDKIYSAIDKTTLHEVAIRHYLEAGNCVLFTNKVAGGSFAATLKVDRQNGGKQQHTYQIDQYQGTGGYMKPKCLRAANILLTAIEKAFLQLDKDTSVSRRTVAFQTK
jgi:hypothetical protein